MLVKQPSSICRTHSLRGIGLAVAAGLALAQSAWCATFSWNANSESNIAGYKVYYGTASGNYSQSADVGKVTQATISTLTPGSIYYAAVAAYNTSGKEGAKSSEVSFTASGTSTTPSAKPSVTLTSPTSGATYTAPATVLLSANAAETGGTISYMEFYNGSSRVVTVTSAPYTFSLGSLAAGSYTFTARAYDTLGVSATSSAVAVTVTSGSTAANQAPVCAIASPANGSTYSAPANLTATVTASDSDGKIAKVEIYNGSALLTTLTSSPYTATFTGVPAGTYTVKAVAYDDKGASTASAPVTVTVGTAAPVNQAPTVSITSPANGASYTAPANVVINATAADADGKIAKVEFYNGSTLIGTDTTSPYSYTIGNAPAGTYSVKAVAYDDDGATATSTTATVTVSAANQAPKVTLTFPSNGARYKAPAAVTLKATASDSDGTIAKVEFYNGSTLVATDTTSPYSASFSGIPAGTYSIQAKAYDNKGATATSATAKVTVTR